MTWSSGVAFGAELRDRLFCVRAEKRHLVKGREISAYASRANDRGASPPRETKELDMPETRSPKPGDYVVVDGSDGPRRDFRISVGLREGWDPEGRVFDVSEAVRTARAWMRRRVEAGEPTLSGMFTRAEVTYAWPRDDGTVGSDREPVALFTGEAVHALSRAFAGRCDRGDAQRTGRRARRGARPGADLCRVR
jgi:hypothetical protein